VEQARRFGVERLAVADSDAGARAAEAWTDGEVLVGAQGLVELVVSSGAELVLNALVGSAGLGPTVAALGEGIDLALANKESLVVGGELVTALAEATGAQLIRSTRSTRRCTSCLAGERLHRRQAALTASGGPSAGARASSSPTSRSRRRSSTRRGPWAARSPSTRRPLMNKGLEVIEAHHLFGTPYHQIDVVVHRSRSSTRSYCSATAPRSPTSAIRTCACRSPTRSITRASRRPVRPLDSPSWAP